MYVIGSLMFHAFATATAVLIGWSTEARQILTTRSTLAVACRNEGTDEQLAFEIANVDRYGIERRLMRAGLIAAMINGVAYFPAQLVAGEFRDAFGWSIDVKLRFASLLALMTTIVWSGMKVHRNAVQAQLNAA